jgi:hypothetical protein
LKQEVQSPASLVAHWSETGTQIFCSLNAHLFEQERHFPFFQSHEPQPKSAGLAVFDGEYTHFPSEISYPPKQVKQFPEALSKVLH